MSDHSQEITIPTIKAIESLLEPILLKLDSIKNCTSQAPLNSKTNKYYRNSDLKNLFGISSNTIIKYRETGVLPYTKLGDVYLYEVKAINDILNNNKISL
ncbi:helix-turn-helix domain-containing protein [Flavivirga rizhaonensis]|uniref:DNA-binding protein n=1 Tax=Flavivirga rizhaonensis TaxID=2559571 RepID=A0A4S1DYL8_9FLAO|nr:helix-turn-helix domain-containing protein [Flavivirga rizhaonensis]TGV03401.1 DNA-binding protein [Flavivirga rizhaonensis]